MCSVTTKPFNHKHMEQKRKNKKNSEETTPWWTPENKAKLREKYKGRLSKAGEWLLMDEKDRPKYLIIVDEKAVLK